MGERQRRPEEMATTSTAVTTVPPQIQEEPLEPVAVITLRPAARTRDRKKVVWTEDTVDNENMNKKKSKCCCIYEKPHKFGESDSEDSDDECEHCFGHVEKRRERRQQQTTQSSDTQTTVVQEPTATIMLPASDPAPSPSPAPLDGQR